MPSTKSKNILLTGGAKGIGRHLVFLPQNHAIYILDLNASELGFTTSTYVPQISSSVSGRVTDLVDPRDIRSGRNAAVARFEGNEDRHANQQCRDRSSVSDGGGMGGWMTRRQQSSGTSTSPRI